MPGAFRTQIEQLDPRVQDTTTVAVVVSMMSRAYPVPATFSLAWALSRADWPLTAEVADARSLAVDGVQVTLSGADDASVMIPVGGAIVAW